MAETRYYKKGPTPLLVKRAEGTFFAYVPETDEWERNPSLYTVTGVTGETYPEITEAEANTIAADLRRRYALPRRPARRDPGREGNADPGRPAKLSGEALREWLEKNAQQVETSTVTIVTRSLPAPREPKQEPPAEAEALGEGRAPRRQRPTGIAVVVEGRGLATFHDGRLVLTSRDPTFEAEVRAHLAKPALERVSRMENDAIYDDVKTLEPGTEVHFRAAMRTFPGALVAFDGGGPD